MERLKLTLRPVIMWVASHFGTRVVDQRTGQVLGRALLLPVRGKIHVIGLGMPVTPVFIPQKRLAYWKQELGFATYPPPDFPHEPGA